MRVILEIQGPIGCGKTQLAQAVENKLKEEYQIEFVSFKAENEPVREVYCFDVFPL